MEETDKSELEQKEIKLKDVKETLPSNSLVDIYAEQQKVTLDKLDKENQLNEKTKEKKNANDATNGSA